MNNIQEEITAIANQIVKTLLLNTYVESFGVLHQVCFIQFRNDQGEDIELTIDSNVVFHPAPPDQLTEMEQILVGMNIINLKRVIDVNCTDTADLEVRFEDGSWFRISGTSTDGYEPWQLSDAVNVTEGGTLLIAQSGGAYAIWEGNLPNETSN